MYMYHRRKVPFKEIRDMDHLSLKCIIQNMIDHLLHAIYEIAVFQWYTCMSSNEGSLMIMNFIRCDTLVDN